VSARNYEWLFVSGSFVRVGYELMENGCWCATIGEPKAAAVGNDQDTALERVLRELGWRLTGKRVGPSMPLAFRPWMLATSSRRP
jgi:hypothetical protein